MCLYRNHIIYFNQDLSQKELNKPVVSDGASLPCGNKV